jgi:hypothetical protein
MPPAGRSRFLSGRLRERRADALVRISLLPARRSTLNPPATRLVRRGEARPRKSQAVPSTLDWAVQYAVPLLGVTGAALYGVLRLAYVFFYLQLRATPEEVGYGYLEVLSSQLIGAIELVLFSTVIIFLVGVAVHGVWWVLRRKRAGSRPLRQALARIAVRAAGIGVAVVLAGLPALGWNQGAKARSGYTVRNVYVLHTIRLPVLAVQAVPASVAWVSETPPGLIDISARRCLLYLGQAAGTAVFYDVGSGESIRVPTSLIVVSLQNADGVPLDC